MKTAPKGYYRQLLTNFPEVRIAYTHTQIIGCDTIDSKPIIEELEKSNDEYVKFYVDGLKNGTLAAIVERKVITERKYANNGELYFTT